MPVAKTGLLPSKIETLGVTFSTPDRAGLVIVAALVVLYFMVAFILYAAVDFLAWRWAYHIAQVRLIADSEAEQKRRVEERERGVMESLRLRPPLAPIPRPRFTYREVVGPVAVVRAIFDFALPIVVGMVAVVALLRMRI